MAGGLRYDGCDSARLHKILRVGLHDLERGRAGQGARFAHLDSLVDFEPSSASCSGFLCILLFTLMWSIFPLLRLLSGGT